MFTGTCHCGAISIEVPGQPPNTVDCNCSICSRYGALWAFFEADRLKISGHPEHTVGYVWGPRTIKTFHCRVCACVTHWEPLEPEPGDKFGVNMRNFAAAATVGVRVRHFDGAEMWAYID